MKRANGEGSKPRRKSNGRYEARATLDTPTGRKRVSFYGATAKEATDKRTAAIADRNRGALFVDPGRLTVREYLERWLTDTARYQVAQSTHGRYQRTCRNHLIPFFDRIKLRDLSPPHIRAFKARKIEAGLNPNTVGVMQGVLSAALNQAVDDGLIFQNPASRVKKAATRGETPMRFSVSGRGFQAIKRRHGHPRRDSINPRPSYRNEPRRARCLKVGGSRPRSEAEHHSAPFCGH